MCIIRDDGATHSIGRFQNVSRFFPVRLTFSEMCIQNGMNFSLWFCENVCQWSIPVRDSSMMSSKLMFPHGTELWPFVSPSVLAKIDSVRINIHIPGSMIGCSESYDGFARLNRIKESCLPLIQKFCARKDHK